MDKPGHELSERRPATCGLKLHGCLRAMPAKPMQCDVYHTATDAAGPKQTPARITM